MEIKRFEVYLIDLEPMVGSEMKKTRPGLVISPDEMNDSIRTVIIVTLTTKLEIIQRDHLHFLIIRKGK